jgi:hypothetical protein
MTYARRKEGCTRTDKDDVKEGMLWNEGCGMRGMEGRI